ncbi:hypothetical protein NQ314_007842 [Rhamnusium bicolor]|uniref:Uncharacterized protein n=1 Tax=Rhamnusium bicolor TaxID=1586634 RepID=A0AAV8YH75_9CUCU|nr:hypothetical protein NQ314_007842 [Rhamnusium bicolor]
MSNFSDKTEVEISEDLSILVGFIGLTLINFSFTRKYRKWSNCLNKIADTRKFGKPADFDAIAKRGNRFTLAYFRYLIFSCVFYGMVHLVQIKECQQINKDKGLHEVCGTFNSIWLPFEGDKLIVQIIIITIQGLLEYYVTSPAGVIFIIPWEAVEVLISHINHFKSNVLKIFEQSTVQGRSDKLKFCIQYHNHILSMSGELNNLVKYTSGFLSFTGAVIFGFTGNYLLNTLSMSEAIYDAQWYKADVNTMKDIRFMLARSQIPIVFEALPLGNFNYPLFLAIIKTAYSYMTLIHQTI